MIQKIITPRTAPVITPERLAAFGRFDVPQKYVTGSSPAVQTDDYTLLQVFIDAATEQVETMAQWACMTEQVYFTLDFFPNTQDPRNFLQYELSYSFAITPWWWWGYPTKDSIEFVRRPVQVPSASPVTNSVAVTYYDPNGVLQTWDSSNYYIQDNKLTLTVGNWWPLTDRRQDCIQITYWAGNTSTPASVDSRLQMAIMFLANHMWENRSIVTVDPSSEVWGTLCLMLSSYRTYRIPR